MKKKPLSPGRPREFDEDEALDRVMELFWVQGYEGTPLSDILVATGLTKGSIYKAFKSKHQLYLMALKRYEDTVVQAGVDLLTLEQEPMVLLTRFLSAPVDDMLQRDGSKGCFLCNASADKAFEDPETRALVGRGFDKLSQALVSVISKIRSDWSPAEVAESAQMILSIYSGLRIMSRSGVRPEDLTSAKNAALRLFE